jgi:hypothetical protein
LHPDNCIFDVRVVLLGGEDEGGRDMCRAGGVHDAS